MAKWSFEAEFIQSCNCDYGCPCAFNAYPTKGSCEALVAYHIRKGTINGTKVDGATFAWGLWWPKAIHEGNGAARLYVDPKATPDQAMAIEGLTSGKFGGGVFEIFPRTFARTHPTARAAIDFHFGGYDSRFLVAGIGEVRSKHVKNPVTGADFEGEILLPGGINFKRAFVTSVDWSFHDGEFQMDHRNAAGFATVTKYTEKGPVSSNPIARAARAKPKAKKSRR